MKNLLLETFENPSISIFGLEIYYYAIIIVLGMIAAVCMFGFLLHKFGMAADTAINYALIIIPVAVLCARFFFFVFPYEGSPHNWSDFWKFRNGGLMIYGGIAGGVFMGWIGAKIHKHDFIKIADLAIPCVALAQAIGRWGNFANQEAFGKLVTDESLQWFPYAVKIDAEGGQWFHATFFYESMWNLIGVAIMLLLLFKFYKKGIVAGTYCIWYGIGRLWIEGLRSDSLYLGSTGIKISQLISGILILAGVLLYLYAFLVKNKKDGSGVAAKAGTGTAVPATAAAADAGTAEVKDPATATAETVKADVQKTEAVTYSANITKEEIVNVTESLEDLCKELGLMDDDK